jgi:WD40 repeat protein
VAAPLPTPSEAPLRLRGHHSLVRFVSWYSTGKRLVSACKKWETPSSVIVWNLDDPDVPLAVLQRPHSVGGLAVSPGDSAIAVAWDDSRIQVLDGARPDVTLAWFLNANDVRHLRWFRGGSGDEGLLLALATLTGLQHSTGCLQLVELVSTPRKSSAGMWEEPEGGARLSPVSAR